MKTITINIPDDCEIQIVRNIACKFKKGDIIVSGNGNCIAVFDHIEKDTDTNHMLVYYSTVYSKINGFHAINKIDYGIGTVDSCRAATEEEIKTLIEELKKIADLSEDARKVLKECFDIKYPVSIKTYQDLIDNNVEINGHYISGSDIEFCDYIGADKELCSVAATERVAKSMKAMAMISQLMPYYGGEVTDEEWEDSRISKYTITRVNNSIVTEYRLDCYYFLAFHTENQRDEFLKYNEQLVNQYLMIDQ